ncbi:PHD finger protein 21B isoform X1 [Triplophysa rosa]|uniref:PHD finger protein 21B n=2 Tax=Triplophysa rosa TaxID=992332 RepID=A0A9W7T976_TRIRA|nr:PHD finger protein 21B isoform X1 [Triplophysa rosa]KAI7792233.1 putative PHD finger protein 21B [Triplophysa rosa]
MELQGLQEALKVEVQCHQKLAVRSCPVGAAAKPLALIKPPSQSIAVSVVPAQTPVSMVTAHINGQKTLSSETLQTSPINLQTPAGQNISRSQMLGALTAIPIKVPHVSCLQRLAGHSPSVLPQVRPKTLIPDSLPHSPCREQQSGQTLAVSQGMAVISPKSQGASLPTANSTFRNERLSNRQEESSSTPMAVPGVSTANPGVAYAIISAASPVTHGVLGVTEAIKVQPLIFSPDSKVIIIQPQIPSSSPASQTDSAVREPSPDPSTPAKKTEEDPEKIAFMVSLGLVTTEHLEEIQSKRQERKRRTTANPTYSGLFEPERKRLASHYLNSAMFLSAKDSEELGWKEELQHDDHCAVCKEDGDLQPCHTCTRAYHPDCLHPPLKTASRAMWMCPKCQKKVLNKENLTWPQNFIQSYVTHKTVREEERRKLMRRNGELKKECEHLSEQDQRLGNSLSKCMELKERLLSEQRDTQASLERLKTLIRLIQRDQMIQFTMTATTTGASLLSLPWIKATGGSTSTTPPSVGPAAVLHKTLLQPQDNN